MWGPCFDIRSCCLLIPAYPHARPCCLLHTRDTHEDYDFSLYSLFTLLPCASFIYHTPMMKEKSWLIGLLKACSDYAATKTETITSAASHHRGSTRQHRTNSSSTNAVRSRSRQQWVSCSTIRQSKKKRQAQHIWQQWQGCEARWELNSLTAIGGRDRPFFYELLCSLVTSTIFVRC